MAKSRSKSRTRSRKSPRRFLVKKGERCPSGFIRTVQVKKSSKKYGTRLPSYCVEFPEVEKFKRSRKTKSNKKSKSRYRKSKKGSRKVSRKGSRKYKFIGVEND